MHPMGVNTSGYDTGAPQKDAIHAHKRYGNQADGEQKSVDLEIRLVGADFLGQAVEKISQEKKDERISCI